MGSEDMTSRAERHVVVPVEPTEAWAHALATALQGSSSMVRSEPPSEFEIERARDWIRRVLSAAPPVQMEAVAWSWEWFTAGCWEKMLSPKRPDTLERLSPDAVRNLRPLYASPVPSSERDDIIEMCAKVVDEYSQLGTWTASETRRDIASAIRSLKSQPEAE